MLKMLDVEIALVSDSISALLWIFFLRLTGAKNRVLKLAAKEKEDKEATFKSHRKKLRSADLKMKEQAKVDL